MNGDGVSGCEDEKVLEMVVTATHQCECAECPRAVRADMVKMAPCDIDSSQYAMSRERKNRGVGVRGQGGFPASSEAGEWLGWPLRRSPPEPEAPGSGDGGVCLLSCLPMEQNLGGRAGSSSVVVHEGAAGSWVMGPSLSEGAVLMGKGGESACCSLHGRQALASVLAVMGRKHPLGTERRVGAATAGMRRCCHGGSEG